jgi:anti-sigma B factor antagonist
VQRRRDNCGVVQPADPGPGFVVDEFGVSVTDGDGCVRVAAWGELDLSSAPELDATLDQVERIARSVVLDLRGLTFLDSSGVTLLLRHTQRAASDGFALSIVAPEPRVARVLELTGVAAVLPLSDGRPE